jgi:hypothetical protein
LATAALLDIYNLNINIYSDSYKSVHIISYTRKSDSAGIGKKAHYLLNADEFDQARLFRSRTSARRNSCDVKK